MRKIYCLIAITLLSSTIAWSQTKPLKIVFDITSKDTLAHQTVLRHVSGMAASHPDAQLEVVVYGGAINMLMKGKSSVAKAIDDLKGNANVSFRACEGTMKRHNITKDQLLPSVGTVPDALIEIVTKQGEGWGYIKETAY